MNIHEGLRRLGIIVGMVGSAVGILSEYDSARNLWSAHVTHQRFESLKEAWKSGLNEPNEGVQVNLEDGSAVLHFPAETRLAVIQATVRKFVLKPPEQSSNVETPKIAHSGDIVGMIRPAPQPSTTNLDRIAAATVDKSANISSIELSTGESIPRMESPTFMAFLSLLLYPVVGFLAPCGTIRVLSWLLAGFLGN